MKNWIQFIARIPVQVTIYSRLLIGRDDHLDHSEAYDISQLVREVPNQADVLQWLFTEGFRCCWHAMRALHPVFLLPRGARSDTATKAPGWRKTLKLIAGDISLRAGISTDARLWVEAGPTFTALAQHTTGVLRLREGEVATGTFLAVSMTDIASPD